MLMPLITRQHAVVTVPNMVDLPPDDAVALLKTHKFQLGGTVHRFDPNFDETQPLRVIAHNPKPGAPAKPGRRIFLFLPKAPSSEVTVPSVSGLSQRNARAMIEGRGLIVRDVIPDTTPSAFNGPVTRVDPGAGTLLAQGDSVTIFFGTGPDASVLVEVPYLIGLPNHSAQEQLRALRLSPSLLDQTDPENDLVIIMRQEPEAGSFVPAGTTIRLYTSLEESEF